MFLPQEIWEQIYIYCDFYTLHLLGQKNAARQKFKLTFEGIKKENEDPIINWYFVEENSSDLRNAISRNDIQYLDTFLDFWYSLDKYCDYSEVCVFRFAESGKLKILKYILQKYTENNPRVDIDMFEATIDAAFYNKHKRIIYYFFTNYQEHFLLYLTGCLTFSKSTKDHMDMIRYMHNKFNFKFHIVALRCIATRGKFYPILYAYSKMKQRLPDKWYKLILDADFVSDATMQLFLLYAHRRYYKKITRHLQKKIELKEILHFFNSVKKRHVTKKNWLINTNAYIYV